MQRSSEESPGQAAPPALTGNSDRLVLPEPDPQGEPQGPDSPDESQQTSTLIEFPGVNRRAEPPWRRELSRRVREVQERRIKEAAEPPAPKMSQQPPPRDPVLSQLELVPELPTPAMNQLVENALRRVERARRIDPEPRQSWSQRATISRHAAATAVARARAKEPIAEALPFVEPAPEPSPAKTGRRSLTRRKLVVVPPVELQQEQVEPEHLKVIARPVRMIADGIEDTALAYLDEYFPEAHTNFTLDHAAPGRRTIAAMFDLVFVAIMTAPFAAAIELAGGDWTDPLAVLLLIAAAAAVMSAYQIFSIALRGQTWGMRLLSIRTVDPATGLIPTGTQAIKRSLAYVLSLATLGVGFLFALVNSERLAPHDRFSGTVVVRE